MSNIQVQTTASGSGTLGGLIRQRGEQLTIASGRIAADDYAAGDVISFALSAAKIVHASFTTSTGSLVVTPNTVITSPLSFPVGPAKGDIDYFIHYRRGSGANLRVTPTLAGANGQLQVARATFNPSAVTGDRTIAAHTLGVTLPDNAVILDFMVDVITTFTSATDAATIAYHLQSADDLLAAIAISDASNVHDAGLHGGKIGAPGLGADAAHDTQLEVAALIAASRLKLTAARTITATVAVEALTAGKAELYVSWMPGS